MSDQIRDVGLVRLHAEQGYGRTMQTMADNSGEINKTLSIGLTTLSIKANQGLIEVGPLEAMGVSTAMTRIDPLSQVAHHRRDDILSRDDAVLMAAINKIGGS